MTVSLILFRYALMALVLASVASAAHAQGAEPAPIAAEANNGIQEDDIQEAPEEAGSSRADMDLPTAKDMDLDAPIADDSAIEFEPDSPLALPAVDLPPEVDPNEVLPLEQIVEEAPHLILLGANVPPSTATRLAWAPRLSFEGITSPTPVLVVHGANPGPVVCLTAAIHGDELNGIEIVRRILYNIEPEELSGTVIGVPIVNLQGFQRSSRYLTDRRDLNRFFPGDPTGSSASRKAYSFFNQVVLGCDALVDLHTGSFHRTNLPQLRADLSNPGVVELTQGFGATVVLQSEGTLGTLRRAAVETGIPAVTLEAGEPQRLQEDAVSHGVKGIQ
ncbi:MAG: M14 family metallopeptidase, partial [Gammaproteobacteria bacterium]